MLLNLTFGSFFGLLCGPGFLKHELYDFLASVSISYISGISVPGTHRCSINVHSTQKGKTKRGGKKPPRYEDKNKKEGRRAGIKQGDMLLLLQTDFEKQNEKEFNRTNETRCLTNLPRIDVMSHR